MIQAVIHIIIFIIINIYLPILNWLETCKNRYRSEFDDSFWCTSSSNVGSPCSIGNCGKMSMSRYANPWNCSATDGIKYTMQVGSSNNCIDSNSNNNNIHNRERNIDVRTTQTLQIETATEKLIPVWFEQIN